MGRRIDELPAGSVITGAEVFPGMIGGVAYTWTTDQLGDYIDGYLNNIGQNLQRSNYTLVLADSGRSLYHPSDDTTARTWTIPANSSVAFEVGTIITFINHYSAGAVTISCGDTMWLAGSATTGNRTLAPGGVATAIKVTTTLWTISGSGLT